MFFHNLTRDSDYWKDSEKTRQFLENLSKKMEIEDWTDWYRISYNQFLESGGETILRKHGGLFMVFFFFYFFFDLFLCSRVTHPTSKEKSSEARVVWFFFSCLLHAVVNLCLPATVAILS